MIFLLKTETSIETETVSTWNNYFKHSVIIDIMSSKWNYSKQTAREHDAILNP